jgi:hypothetical protein
MSNDNPELLTEDELALIAEDKKGAGPADAGDPETVPPEQDAEQDFPLGEGVDADRAERWAVYDTWRLAYVNGTVRTRPPTAKMVADLERGREWRRV